MYAVEELLIRKSRQSTIGDPNRSMDEVTYFTASGTKSQDRGKVIQINHGVTFSEIKFK